VGNTKGVLNSLFMVPELKKGFAKVLKLNPNHHYARDTLARVFHAVPGLAGGSDSKAEEHWNEIFKRDPHFTPGMYQFGKFWKNKGKKDKAREWWTRCVNEKKSSVPNDFRKFDKANCQKALKSL
jgi:hypothetical protein